MQIEWSKANFEDYKLAGKIAKRVLKKMPGFDRQSLEMDIIATHISGCKLKLSELLKADDSNFFHDALGIYHNLDRATGKLQNFFLPRYAV